MNDLIFEWDSNKAEINLRKHNIPFELAMKVFEDPLHITEQDCFENGEYRWQTIGIANGEQLLLVAHVFYNQDDAEIIRIISARRANKTERKKYDNR